MKTMARYDDDQCERCGGIRVANSTLCARCLVKERDHLDKEILIKDATILMLKGEFETQTGYLDDALKYGFKKNQENIWLLNHIKGLNIKIREVMEDGKDRMDTD